MEQIRNYLETVGLSEGAIRRRLAEFERNIDIAMEFENWIQNGAGEFVDGVTVEGYTAKQIKNLAPFMDGVGVYSFLISLRKDPERAKKYLADGFPVR